MKARRNLLPLALAALPLLGAAPLARAQVVPATPGKFTTRGVGGASGTGSATIGLAPSKPQTTVRTVTYIALSEPRQWKSTDGKSLLGKLIAFEDAVVETKVEAGAKPPPAPAPTLPPHPTVVREGRARLLVDHKAYEVPLERLTEDDRKFVAGIQAAVAAKAKPPGDR